MRFYPVSLDWLRLQNSKAGSSSLLPHVIPDKEERIWLIPEIPLFLQDASYFSYYEFILPPVQPQTISSIYSETPNIFFPTRNANFQPNQELARILQGRRLLHDELAFSMEEIHTHAANGLLTYQPGIERRGRAYICHRCGNDDRFLFGQYPCFRCKQECLYCRSCIMMGKVTTCSPLLTWSDDLNSTSLISTATDNQKHTMAWTGTLSFYQQKASNALLQTILDFNDGKNMRDKFLIWAVCSAGNEYRKKRALNLPHDFNALFVYINLFD